MKDPGSFILDKPVQYFVGLNMMDLCMIDLDKVGSCKVEQVDNNWQDSSDLDLNKVVFHSTVHFEVDNCLAELDSPLDIPDFGL
jgi:hypothetical protein